MGTLDGTLGWPYGKVTESEVLAIMEKDLKRFGVPRGSALVMQSIWVFGFCLVPIYGVLFLGWDAFALIVLFYAEGLAALVLDAVRLLVIRARTPHRFSQQLGVWIFMIVFLNFSGFFMLLFQGPHGEDLGETLRLLFGALQVTLPEMSWPLFLMILFQLVGLLHDTMDSGKGHDMHLTAGPYMLLIFITPLIAALFGLFASREVVGLMVITVLRMLGQLLMVWIVPVYYRFASNTASQPKPS